MTCKKCGTQLVENASYCHVCGAAVRSSDSHAVGAMYYLFSFGSILLILSLLLSYCLNTLTLGGKYYDRFKRENGYDLSASMVADYIAEVRDGKMNLASCCYAEQVFDYYASQLKTYDDIIWSADEAYQLGYYSSDLDYEIRKTVEWDPAFFSSQFSELGIEAENGLDIYVRFDIENADGTPVSFIYETIEIDGSWYLLTVYN